MALTARTRGAKPRRSRTHNRSTRPS
jgi:hypothetical protein